ncbi:hypothetical protein KSB_30700 [Ktedonobacter robiniae]|uniref:Uncharacterized protein n=1 Tax=Ktedonobacter robiniae TaxID=2778365 RepID=A0ABQ3UQF5_9CHLR|nr:hypothetical protein KSB_30700 [Ktedonobacter robiniae]
MKLARFVNDAREETTLVPNDMIRPTIDLGVLVTEDVCFWSETNDIVFVD